MFIVHTFYPAVNTAQTKKERSKKIFREKPLDAGA